MIYAYKGFKPYVHPDSFVHPLAAVTGRVEIGANVYIGPGAAIRGDWGRIKIADGCNIQENCVIHMFPGITVILEENSHVGHGAVIHGAHLKKNCLIGMNAVIMDNVLLGEGSIVGALSFIKTGMEIPDGSVVVGSPARVVSKVSDDMLDWKREGTLLYQQLASEMQHEWKECEPLRKKEDIKKDEIEEFKKYKIWKETKENGEA